MSLAQMCTEITRIAETSATYLETLTRLTQLIKEQP